MSRPWSGKEIEYLHDRWGTISISGIAKVLGRSVDAIKTKAFREGLKRFIHSGDYVTLNQLMLAIRGRKVGTYDLTCFIKNRALPVKTKVIVKQRVRVVYLDDFWEWAKKNRTFVNFSKFEENMLGVEPGWVKEQRQIDQIKAVNFKRTPWTPGEDERLRFLVSQYKYGYAELSCIIQRTEGAIKRRLLDLGVKQRPLRAENCFWTDPEIAELKELLAKGFDYGAISARLGKSALACRGKVERLENPEYMRKYHIKQRLNLF